MSNELTPETRRERYYDAMLGGDDMPADPHTREERYLEAIVEAIEAGGATDEKIQEAVNTYMEDNPEAFEEALEPIIDGTQPVGHSKVADNLTPYSEDSGTIQENPFISQGTGTDNNSVIVTTGVIARQLEKQGNTIVKNQLVPNPTFTSATGWTESNVSLSVSNNVATLTSTDGSDYGRIISYASSVETKVGHKYLTIFDVRSDDVESCIATSGSGWTAKTVSTSWQTYFVIAQTVNSVSSFNIGFSTDNDANDTIQFRNVFFIDLTQMFNGNDNIPADLLSNPSHFSWYYNGSLAYDAGSLQNCNGRYLECGQGRQLWDEEWEVGAYIDGIPNVNDKYIRSNKDKPILVTPSKPIAITRPISRIYVFEYDANLNYIGRQFDVSPKTFNYFTMSPNTRFIKFCYGGDEYPQTSYANNVTVSLYYTPAEGGEGYDAYYPYVAPIRIDTGNETLYGVDCSRDTKLPSGAIKRVRKRYTFTGNETWEWVESWGAFRTFAITDAFLVNGNTGEGCTALLPGYEEKPQYSTEANKTNMTFVLNSGYHTPNALGIINTAYGESDLDAFKAYIAGKTIEYPLATPTTEQGTPFSEYAPINDYSYMAWFDTDGNLVSIPQGCKLFYPVDYKGFTDDLVMYTNGDATTLAKKTDIPTAPATFLESVTGYDATKTQTLKNVEGILTWVDDPAEP